MPLSENNSFPDDRESVPEAERFLPGMSGAIADEHLHRYALAASLTKGMRVLDVASGEGYGSALLAVDAQSVVGVDIDSDTVASATKKYVRSNLEFRCGNAERIPASDAEFDAVVSLETIEHLPDHGPFLTEIQRVLRAGGLLIISSPDKHFYSEVPAYSNPYHLSELHGTEFRSKMSALYRHVAVLGQRVTKGSLMLAENSEPKRKACLFRSDGTNASKMENLPDAVYLLAICTNGTLPDVPESFFEYGDPNSHPFPNPYVEPAPNCQLYPPHIDGYSEYRSRLMSYTSGRETRLVFPDVSWDATCPNARFRFDPCDGPGVVKISQLLIRDDTGECLCEFGPGKWPDEVEVCGTAWRLSQKEELSLFSFGSDPQILLPALHLPAVRICTVEVTLVHLKMDVAGDALLREKASLHNTRADSRGREKELEDLRTKLRQTTLTLSALQQEYRTSRMGANHCFRLGWELNAKLHKTMKSEVKRLEKRLLASGKKPKPTDRRPLEDLRTLLPYSTDQVKAAAELALSGVFDLAWYVQQYPDVAASGMDPLMHYITHGVAELRDPNPYFHTAWYLQRNPDVVASGTNPLLHFVRNGWREGRQPNPDFDVLSYLEENPAARASELHPLLHFQLYGAGIRAPMPGLGLESNLDRLDLKRREVTWRDRLRLARGDSPLISVVVPLHKTPLDLLHRTVQSVLAQEYDTWELCLVDDGSNDRLLTQELASLSQVDSRIKVQLNPENRGISAATNDAIELSTGKFVALLDHDDELTPDALGEVVALLAEQPDTDVVYTDQDKMDRAGCCYQPYHKPAWSPVFFLGVMYVGHLLVVRRSILDQAGHCDPRFDKVQDFELMLRISERTQRIRHIPKILYHWRAVEESLAFSTSAKSSIEELQLAAVAGHLKRRGAKAAPVINNRHPHRIAIEPVQELDLQPVSIIIPSTANKALLMECLTSLVEKTTYPIYEILVLVRKDPTRSETQSSNLAAARRVAAVRVVEYDFPFNYSRVNNLGAREAAHPMLLFLNDDTQVITPNWIEIMVAHLHLAGVGAVGPKLLSPDGSVQHAGVVLGFRGTADHVMRATPGNSDGYFGSLSASREVSAVTGACLMMRAATYQALGGMKEGFASIYQDVDLCLRVWKLGYSIIWVANAELMHHESATRGSDYDRVDREILIDCWHEQLASDPYYNINFTRSRHDYTLRPGSTPALGQP